MSRKALSRDGDGVQKAVAAVVRKHVSKTVSVPPGDLSLIERAELKAARLRRSFSGYVMALIEADLADETSGAIVRHDGRGLNRDHRG